MKVYWLEQAEEDVPETNNWLSATELSRMNDLHFAKRRSDWRLGRWTAKRTVAGWLRWPTYPHVLARIEIRATPSGAPEVLIPNCEKLLTISLSHRARRGMCAISTQAVGLGCDLELIEPRGDNFVADYFTPEEQSLVLRTPPAERPRIVTLLWSAKESALKALGQGLRLDTRCATVSLVGEMPDLLGWSHLQVRCFNGQCFQGWWRSTDLFVRTVVAHPIPECPISLERPQTFGWDETIVGPSVPTERARHHVLAANQ